MRTEKLVSRALEHIEGDRYMLTSAIGRRVKQLQDGAKPLVKADLTKDKMTDVALREIAEGHIIITKN